MTKIILAIPMIILLVTLGAGCDQCPADEFLSEDVDASILLKQICDGGPGKSGIPALTNPKLLSAEAGDVYLHDSDLVIRVTFNGESRAYPVRILNWHEIVCFVVQVSYSIRRLMEKHIRLVYQGCFITVIC